MNGTGCRDPGRPEAMSIGMALNVVASDSREAFRQEGESSSSQLYELSWAWFLKECLFNKRSVSVAKFGLRITFLIKR